MNWGKSIALVYIAFVGFMLTLVIGSTQQESDLVREDYYAAELAFEDRMDQIRNLEELGTSVEVQFQAEAQEIQIQLPANTDVSKGTIWLYRPSDARQDQYFDLNSESFAIATQELESGLWRVQTEWTASNGKAYWQENSFLLP